MNASSWRAFWQTITRFQKDKVALDLAFRNALGVSIPILFGVLTGGIGSAAIVATGALNVSFSDSNDPYRRRAGRMLIASLIVASAVTLGSLAGQSHTAAVILSMAWAFAAGMLVAVGAAEADIGLISLVTLVVFSAEPQSPSRALSSGTLALAGGLLQTVLSTALWPLRAFAPERRALAELYLALGRDRLSFAAGEAPPATLESNKAQQAVAGYSRSVAAQRHRSLLNQAERIRISLLALRRLRARLLRIGNEGAPIAESIDLGLEGAKRILSGVGLWLQAGTAMRSAREDLRRLDDIAEELREAAGHSPEVAAMTRDARAQLDALAGQLRASVDLAASATESGLSALRRREARRPWGLRVVGVYATLRANLNVHSAAFRHAVRMSVCVAAADAIGRGFGLQRSYWVPMTVAIILKPDFAATFSRGLLRFGGTFAGLAISTALFRFLPPDSFAAVLWIAVFTFFLRAYGAANYGILTLTITGLVVMLFALVGIAPAGVIKIRGIDTLVGGSIALLAFQLWPTWERTRIAESLASMLDAYRLYFRALRRGLKSELQDTRVSGRLARTNLEAAIDRLSAEPGFAPERLETVNAMLASTHRVIHAMMALEASGVKPSPSFETFANHVELTLYFQAAALRGSPLNLEDLPALREAHHTIVSQGNRHGLFEIETDRLTNSLNTLTAQIHRWSLDPGVSVPQRE